MRKRLGLAILALAAVAFRPAAAPAIETYSSSQFRQVVAKATIPDRNSEPLYFSVVAGVFWAPEIAETTTGDGIYYQFGGSLDVGLDGRQTTLAPGEGLFVPAGARLTLAARDAARPPNYLHFLLSPGSRSDIAADGAGTSVELYRSPNPIPGLVRERNLLSLTKVPVPPQSPPDPLHRRSGAALHYVLSGLGAEFGEGRATARGPGSISYEPAGYAYQWSNPGANPLVYLVFNVNPKDEDPVIALDQRPEEPVMRDPHLTVALYCVAISMGLAVVVSSATIADYRRERRNRAGRDPK